MKLKPITVYCAHCWRPLARRLLSVKVRTETCERVLVWQRVVTKGGNTYWESDGAQMCSVEVLFP